MGPALPVKDPPQPLSCLPPLGTNPRDRTSDVPSEESQTSERKKLSGKARFFEISSGKYDLEESEKSAGGDCDLADADSLVTEDPTFNHNPQHAYTSGALPNASHNSSLKAKKHGKSGSADDTTMPPS